LEENRTGSFWGYFAGKYEAGDRFTSNFTGFTYKLNWKSFYLQTGPMWGENAFKHPRLLFWAGWLFEL